MENDNDDNDRKRLGSLPKYRKNTFSESGFFGVKSGFLGGHRWLFGMFSKRNMDLSKWQFKKNRVNLWYDSTNITHFGVI